MINYSNPIFIKLRIIGQNLGILRPTVRIFRRLFNLSYEDGFDRQMMDLISENEIIWDIGANVGYFTTKFSDKVGNNGKVIAFEPTPRTFNTLVSNCSLFENVICHNMALSNKSGKFHFRDSGIENDPTNGLTDSSTLGAIEVTVTTGNDIVTNQIAPLPTSIKIDVEGFEIDVIQGMSEILKSSYIKKLFIEVHFLEMNKRGIANGSTEIVKIISDSGFTVRWTDPSHVIALRK